MRWNLLLLAAVPVICLSVYPQLLMWIEHGAKWQGSYASVQKDEWVYSAYLNALINGRPRRNDPYTGQDDLPGKPQPESYFSIQFVPAYLLAIPARILGLSASTVFVLLLFIAPFLTALAIYWLINICTEDSRLAAAGSIVVICLSALVAREGLVSFLKEVVLYTFLPFIRRYQPSVTFPLFFLMCGLIWKALNREKDNHIYKMAIGVGLIVSTLIFSYFYLWTAALAWLILIAALWLLAHPKDWKRTAKLFGIVLVIVGITLVPYAILLSHRAESAFTSLQIIYTRQPDLYRGPEWVGILGLVILLIGKWKGPINWRDPLPLFTSSFLLLPFLLFNQQIITGRSLQAFHYELFIGNYVVLIGLVMAMHIAWKASKQSNLPRQFLFPLAVASILWASFEVAIPTKVLIKDNRLTENVVPIGKRLTELGKESVPSRGLPNTQLVLSSDIWTGIELPTFSSQALFWTPTFATQNISEAESRERFYQHLYYTGVDEQSLIKELEATNYPFLIALFGQERVVPGMVHNPKPVTKEDITFEAAQYRRYIDSFSREKAAKYNLSYIVLPSDKEFNLSNLDRWFERDKGEPISTYTLYQVRIR
jgi:hypothetical protein